MAASARDRRGTGSVLEWGRSLGGGNDNLLQCSSLENPMDRGAWQAVVRGITKSQTRWKLLSTHGSLLFPGLFSSCGERASHRGGFSCCLTSQNDHYHKVLKINAGKSVEKREPSYTVGGI